MMASHSERELTVEYWDINDLSHYLNVKVKTLYAMIQKIPHYRIGRLIRFRKEDVDSWMERKKVNVLDESNISKKETSNIHVDRIVRKAIDQSKNDVYNRFHGKSDRDRGTQ
ncbi:MAG: helix-turn-helix domain-containing protein [Deltaproteobacteria bacterium]|nr:helix-turn-helix domain-containing protein [Deltaproteobacteria bacterium]MBN2686714.1 helix-turn-helix domain-containing protein [Deltaproteobacteria bacterium]